MKFIHVADLHLDTPLVSLKNNRELVRIRRNEHKQIFKDVIKLAKSENVDMLFIAGDLFEHKFVENNTIDFIIKTLELIPNVKIFITPGNHDPMVKNSPYCKYDWPDNVKIFGERIERVVINDEVDVYGFGFENFEMDSEELDVFKLKDPDKTNILITHGTLAGANKKYNDVNPKKISIFDYVALGHIHMPKIDNNVVYPGALIGCGFDECGEHGLILGNISGKEVTYEFRNMERRHFEEIAVNISDMTVPSDIHDKLNLENNFYKIILTGARHIEIKDVIDEIKNSCVSIVDVKDDTTLPYDLEEIAKQQTLKGIFTRKMLEEIEKDPMQKSEILKAIEITYAAF